jgi:tetratricopeptide (TPR) repeat protein
LEGVLPVRRFGTALALDTGGAAHGGSFLGGDMNAISSAEEHFRRGEDALQEQDHARALEYFRAANRLDPTSPRYRSYFGLCLGLAERRFDKALDLCRSAAKEEFFNPALYHNLARVHLAFGFKAEGIRYLRRGLMIDPENEPITADLRALGVRRLPPLRFLSRRHVLNRWLGALRRHLRLTRQQAEAFGSEA